MILIIIIITITMMAKMMVGTMVVILVTVTVTMKKTMMVTMTAAHKRFVCWLLASHPSNRLVYLRDGSAQTILRAATLR